MSGDCWRFRFTDNRILVGRADEIRKDLAAFTSLQVDRLHVMMSEGGWLRIKRDLRGYILVGYHVTRGKEGAAVRGEVELEPDAAEGLCQEIAGLL